MKDMAQPDVDFDLVHAVSLARWTVRAGLTD